MSTTRIIILFIIFFAIITIPLVVIYIWFSHLLGRYESLVENIIASLVFGLVIALLLDFTIRRRQEKSLEKVARVGLSEASHQANRIIGLFAAMIKASSSGFRPKHIDELFGPEAAELISLHLDLRKPAPVTPNTPWPVYLANEVQYILDKLSEVQNRYQAFFSKKTLTAIAELRINPLFIVLKDASGSLQQDLELQIDRPVLNILPPNTLKELMEDILNSIKTLTQDALRLQSKDTPHFPRFEFQDNVLPKFGEARYDGPPGPPTFIGTSETGPIGQLTC